MEYMVVIYSKLTKIEDYEYFTNKKDSIKYAKYMADENTITCVYENNEIVWSSEQKGGE